MAMVVSHRASPENSATFRRSWASAIAPPYSPATTSGTSAKSPSRPTLRLEEVSA
jgi:hypothetical protein